MYLLGSAALICVVFAFSVSSTRYVTEGANVKASTTSNNNNVPPINDSELLKAQELNINPTKTIVAEQSINSSVHSHHCHHCHNKTSHKNDSIMSNRDGNSTVPKTLLLKTSHKPDDKSNRLQLETTKFITAEKGLPHEEGLLVRDDTKDNIVIVLSNNSNIIPEGAKLNISQPELALNPPKIISNHTEFVEEISNETVGDGVEEVASWIKSPLLQNTFKYLVTDFYPEKILNSLSNRLSLSNRTKVGETVNPSVVYPLVMEGVSVLLNRLTDDSRESKTGEAQGVIRGRIANIMIESIDKLLQNKKFLTGGVERPVEDAKSNLTPANEKANGTDGMINLDTVKSLLPLIQTVQNNGELSDVVSTFLSNSQSQDGDLDLNSILKNYGSQFNGVLSNTRVLNAIAKQTSNLSDGLNLTSIMEQFMPKNGGAVEGDMSPKNPLLRSEFVSKAMSKSPVAHLGALDENIKKLVMSSLERAVSRVKIDQNGQIHMSDGIKKMVNKMLQDSESKSTGTSALDSINEVLKTVVQMSSGPMNVTEQLSKSRRNVTKHSHLHRRFQEKYGKDPRVRNSSPSTSSSSFVVLLMPLTVWCLLIQ